MDWRPWAGSDLRGGWPTWDFEKRRPWCWSEQRLATWGAAQPIALNSTAHLIDLYCSGKPALIGAVNDPNGLVQWKVYRFGAAQWEEEVRPQVAASLSSLDKSQSSERNPVKFIAFLLRRIDRRHSGRRRAA